MNDISWKFPRHLAAIFILLSGGVLALSCVYYEHQMEAFFREQEAQLTTVVGLKVKAIVNWRTERIHDARFIFDDPFFALEVQDWLDGKSPKNREGEIRQRLVVLKQNMYEAVVLTDSHGTMRLSIPEVQPEIASQIRAFAMDAISTGKIVVSDLYLSGGNEINMTLAIPVHFDELGEKRIVGAVLLQIDPKRVLYPIILSWPVASSTSEITMVRREDKNVLYLNELRFRKNAALRLRISLDELDVPSVKASQGYEGIVQGVDYRGVPVLAATRHIPDSPWFITAKIDESEIYANASTRFGLVLFLMFSLIAASGFGIAYFWRNRDVHLLRRQYEGERERSALARRYEYLTRYANDIIIIMDRDQKIIEVNDRAVETYGYQREELIGQHLGYLSPEEYLPVTGTPMPEMKEQDGLTFETLHRRRDKTTFPVEVSSSVLQIGEERFYQQIVRDLSGRMRREKALQESERQLRFLTSELLMAQESERSRISAMLHDELGQGLIYCKFRLVSLEKDLRNARMDPLAIDCSALLPYMDEMLDYVRSLSRSLSIPPLKEFGFIASVRHLFDEFKGHYEIGDCPLDLDAVDDFLSGQTQTHIFRVLQECLTNIARHSGANRVSLSIKKQSDRVSFIMEDNGAGFEVDPVPARNKTSGIGIASMRERVMMCGGAFTIWSSVGEGTRVQFSVPCSLEGLRENASLQDRIG